jgi:hypothetical protein
VRVSLISASAVLAFGLALSACSSNTGSSSAMPSSGAQGSMVKSHGHNYSVRLMPGVKPLTIGCDYSEYSFCFYVEPGNPGPYVETSAGEGYELYNEGWIVKNKSKKGKPDKKFDSYFYPDPGNPTYQYIVYSGKNPKKTEAVKFTDYYCISFTPSGCTGTNYTLKLGVALEPGT